MIRTWESENSWILWRLSSLALMRASRMASASAINAEQTKGRLVEPLKSTSPSTFLMIQPIPPTFVLSCHAPSVQHEGTEETHSSSSLLWLLLSFLEVCCFPSSCLQLRDYVFHLKNFAFKHQLVSCSPYVPSSHGINGEELKPIGGNTWELTVLCNHNFRFPSIWPSINKGITRTFDQKSTAKRQ